MVIKLNNVPGKRLCILNRTSQPITASELTHPHCFSSDMGLVEKMAQLCLHFFHIATVSDSLTALS